MTKPRFDGGDSPFGDWLRKQPFLSSQHFVASDVDWMMHRYRPEVDRQGTREINYMMFLETKTYCAELSKSQHETLWFHHQLLNKRRRLALVGGANRRAVWHFGVSLLTMEGDHPTDGELFWGRFAFDGSISRVPICERQLIQLLRFDIEPNHLRSMNARRHHKTQAIEITEKSPLGFEITKRIVQRS